MLQQLLLYIIAIYGSIHSIYANCRVERVIMREPREHDIGLIFDLTISNRNTVQSQMLQFTVNSNGVCTLNLTSGKQVQAGTLFGGDFASIAPGYSATVSLVLPTESVYNRVGSCPIVIRSINEQNEMVDNQRKILHFDTRFETLDPSNQSLRGRQEFVDCNNWDKNYLSNCTPLDCEERYFGLLSFYNQETEHCEEPTPPPPQTSSTTSVETTTTPTTTTTGFREAKTKAGKTDEKTKQRKPTLKPTPKPTPKPKSKSKQSTFDFNIWELHPYGGLRRNHKQHQEIIVHSAGNKTKEHTNSSLLHLMHDAKIETLATKRKPKKNATLTSELKRFYYTWYNVAQAGRGYWSDISLEDEESSGPVWEELNESQQEEKIPKAQSSSSRLLHQLAQYSGKEWLLMAMEALLLIMITCFIYAVVCICLFGLLEIIVGMAKYKTTSLHLNKTLTPRHKKNPQDLRTSASLMSVLK